MAGKKRLREEQETNSSTMADRLSDLPESLQFLILSSLKTRDVVRTSVLSKSWVSTWTRIPLLNFCSYGFKKLYNFDKFVYNVLSLPASSVKSDKLSFRRHGTSSFKILKKVIDYAFSHGVRELEVNIESTRKQKNFWPISSHTSWDSLTSLTLVSYMNMECSFLGPTSGSSFKNLTNLRLRRVVITDLDPFSGFPALEKLTLDNCHLNTRDNCDLNTHDKDNVLNVIALQLSELTISHYSQRVNHCELTTPKLRYFDYQGVNFPRVKIHDCGLPVLDTVIIGYTGFCSTDREEKVLFDDLLALFGSFHNAKSLTVFSSVVHLLTLFQDKLVNRCSPFRELKCLKLDFSHFYFQKLFQGPCRSFSEVLSLLPGVRDYLLQKSHDADCMLINLIDPRDPNAYLQCSRSHAAQKCDCVRTNTIKLT